MREQKLLKYQIICDVINSWVQYSLFQLSSFDELQA